MIIESVWGAGMPPLTDSRQTGMSAPPGGNKLPGAGGASQRVENVSIGGIIPRPGGRRRLGSLELKTCEMVKGARQMKLRSLGVAIFGAVCMGAGVASAAAVPVEVDCTSLVAIQTYNVGESATDQTYLLVSGTADGKSTTARFPQTGTWPTAPKQQPVDSKKPVALWKGQLDDGHYAVVTVILMQGEGNDEAKTKDLLSKLDAAEKGVSGLGKPTLS